MINFVNKNNPLLCPLNVLKENYLKTVKKYAKSVNTIQKGLKERIPNHILHP